MKRNSEPSKKHETNASTSMFVSLRMYLMVNFVVFTLDSASSCWSSVAFSDASRWLAP